MFYFKVLLLLALATDVFGFSVRESAHVGIVGGDPVPISDVPFMAGLRVKKTGVNYCGGSIIHKRFVLTAAHCCHPNIIVAVGTDNIYRGDRYEVEKIIRHKMFDINHFSNDICLVKLTKEITFGRNVNFTELAPEHFQLKTGMAFKATGWGNTQPESQKSDVLRLVSVPFVDQSKCKQIYGNKVSDKIFCAGDDGKGTCNADSGGPLVWNNWQVGITSFGAKCGVYPGVFTKISAFHQWINDTIASNI